MRQLLALEISTGSAKTVEISVGTQEGATITPKPVTDGHVTLPMPKPPVMIVDSVEYGFSGIYIQEEAPASPSFGDIWVNISEPV